LKASITLFDYISDIVAKKQGNLPLDNYVPFLIARWLSFINPSTAEFVNQFNTKGLLENKELHYKTLVTCFPKLKWCPKISYIKKAKEMESQNDNQMKIKMLAESLELSVREASGLFWESSTN
jgi:hypothetical protein